MRSYFVTATGTDIGKTYITAGLLRAAREIGRQFYAIKPILSGYSQATAAASDSAILLAAMEKRVTHRNIAAITPWRFSAPLSPDMAAAREGKAIHLPALTRFCQAAMGAGPHTLLIEGAGGVAVPITPRHTIADWIAALDIPAILVTGTYLGTLSHTLTAAEYLTTRNIRLAAIIVNESLNAPTTPPETAATLARYLPAPIHIIPRTFNDRSFREIAASL